MKKFLLLFCVFCVIGVSPLYAIEDSYRKMDDIVVSATKTSTPIREIPATVDVLTADDLSIQSQPNGDFVDLLRDVSGSMVTRAYGPFPGTVRLRGGVGSTVYLINGIPVDWKMNQAIPTEIIERVEIIKGAASAVYGANATGGVINIITKTGTEDLQGQVRIGGGTSTTYRAGVLAQGKKNNAGLAVAAYQGGSAGENVVENNVHPTIHMIDRCKYNKSAVSVSGKYDFGEASSLSLFYNYFWDDYARGRIYYGGEWARNFASAVFNQGFGDIFSMKASIAYHVDDLLHTYDMGGTNYTTPKQRRYTDYTALPLEVQFTGNFFGGGDVLTLGYFRNDETEEMDYRAWTTNAQTMLTKSSDKTWAVFAQNSWKITDDLIFSTGLRYDEWENYDNYFSNYVDKTPADRSEDAWSPKAGLRYNFSAGSSIWASYGQGFETPTAAQLYDDRTSGGTTRIPNPNLKPEKTHSYELGFEHWFGSVVNMRLVAFHAYTEDEISSIFTATNTVTNKNVGKTVSTGAELNMDFYLTPEISTGFNYTYDKAEVDENPEDPTIEGNAVPFAPEHKATVYVAYTKPDDLTARLSMRYFDDCHVNDTNEKYNAAGEQLYMNSAIVVNVKATKTLCKNCGWLDKMDLSLSVDNLFNEEYRVMQYYEDPGTVVFCEFGLYF